MICGGDRSISRADRGRNYAGLMPRALMIPTVERKLVVRAVSHPSNRHGNVILKTEFYSRVGMEVCGLSVKV
jgi:hypothetical protein